MRREGLTPIPQYGIQGYDADFAFPDVRLAVEHLFGSRDYPESVATFMAE